MLTNLSLWHKKQDKCFTSKILAIQYIQWFYKADKVVLMTHSIIAQLTFVKHHLFSTKMPSINDSDYVDDVHANRNDHDEGLWKTM